MIFFAGLLLLGVVLTPNDVLWAQEQEVPSDSLVSISLSDGTTLQGTIVGEDETSFKVVTPANLEVEVPKASIISIKPLRGRMVEGRFYRFDPNYSRLLFAPTGRSLRKGEGYFTDSYVFLPGIAVGLSNKVTILAGVSVIPGVGLGDQLKYIAPKIGIQNSSHFALSIGALCVSVEEVFAGVTYSVMTIGPPDQSFTAGLGLGYTKEENEDLKFADHPVIMLGANLRMSNNTAFVTENWFITGENVEFSEQPFSLAIRFFGDRLAADVGAILIGEVLKEGLPIPWLSFTYNFGR